MTSEDLKFLKTAIKIAEANISEGGGPFGAVVVRENSIVSMSGNRVVPENDPTAHAEVQAIRKAASSLGTFDLGDCVLYSSCEPCPMCLGAVYWSGIKRLVFASDRHRAAASGFSDEMIYREINLETKDRKLLTDRSLISDGDKVFDIWDSYPDKTKY